ncbi:MAG: peptidoglycan bridge formation glycyltransferase FemA/FemB family protein [Oscillibacter sp.]|nr:peptidoglycan bridge formation glycyltransferase FemA/FemB family protein [Oscillibacter sp.]
MLTVYTLRQSEEWDSIVRSFHDYDVYWLNGYVKAFQIHGDGEPLLFYCETDGGRGVNVVMKRDIAKDPRFAGKIPEGRYFDFSTPYGYGGWLIEGERRDSIFDAYGKCCQEMDVVSEFMRFHPVIGNHAQADAYEVIRLGPTVAMDLTSPDVIWANVTSKNRNVIRKAQNSGVKIYNGRFPKIYDTFRDIYNATMDKDHAETYYYFPPEFYCSILYDLSLNAQVFYAVKDETVIAVSIMLTANGRMNYHLSGSLKEYASLAATNLLLYQAALWGCANGCKTLYLGGGVGSGEDSLFKFKKAFYRGDDLPYFHIGRKVWNAEMYQYLASLRSDIPQESRYFPAYRA